MRVRFVPVSIVLVVTSVMVLGIVFFILGTSSAVGQDPASSVIPKVNVESGGSLSITGGTTGANVIDFGNMGPGQTLERTLKLGITANNAWHLTVSKDQDMTVSYLGAAIPSANFTFTSTAGTPPPSGTPSYFSNSQFGTNTNVVTNGAATGGSNVNVVYSLMVPGDQSSNDPKQGYYSALHTYTLVVGSP